MDLWKTFMSLLKKTCIFLIEKILDSGWKTYLHQNQSFMLVISGILLILLWALKIMKISHKLNFSVKKASILLKVCHDNYKRDCQIKNQICSLQIWFKNDYLSLSLSLSLSRSLSVCFPLSLKDKSFYTTNI